MTFDRIYRKGTSRERQARALRLAAEYEQKLGEAIQASALADQLNTREAHLEAARTRRRVVSPCTKLGLDATIHRDVVQRHIDAAQLIQRSQRIGRTKSHN